MTCTDGGYTGCSLSRVSKAVREASRAGRFTAISLQSASADCVHQFLFLFTQQRACAIRAGTSQSRIRYLFLASPRRTTAYEPLSHSGHTDHDLELRAYQSDVNALIELVAPDLQALFLLEGQRSFSKTLWLPSIGRTTNFPMLQELYLTGSSCDFVLDHDRWSSWSRLGADEDTTSYMYPPLPCLTRLHLSDAAFNVAHWAERSPGVTHLRLTNLCQDSSLEGIIREFA